jgi:hypothetical protein
MSIRKINVIKFGKWCNVGGNIKSDNMFLDDLDYYLKRWDYTVEKLIWSKYFELIPRLETTNLFITEFTNSLFQKLIRTRKNAIMKLQKTVNLPGIINLAQLHYDHVEVYDTPLDYVIAQLNDRNSEPFYTIEWENFQNGMVPEVIDFNVKPYDYNYLQDLILNITSDWIKKEEVQDSNYFEF